MTETRFQFALDYAIELTQVATGACLHVGDANMMRDTLPIFIDSVRARVVVDRVEGDMLHTKRLSEIPAYVLEITRHLLEYASVDDPGPQPANPTTAAEIEAIIMEAVDGTRHSLPDLDAQLKSESDKKRKAALLRSPRFQMLAEPLMRMAERYRNLRAEMEAE